MRNNLGVLQAVLIDPPVPPRVLPTRAPNFDRNFEITIGTSRYTPLRHFHKPLK